MKVGSVVGIFALITGVAFLTVALGSPNTSNIINAVFNGFTGSLKASMGR